MCSKHITHAQETDRNYAPIEKEIVVLFACKKYHEYHFGKETKFQTDHKPIVDTLRNHSITLYISLKLQHQTEI